jgi:hypothetical protein
MAARNLAFETTDTFSTSRDNTHNPNIKEMTITSKIQSLLKINSYLSEETETVAPNAFTYSLFYVYYDQYTYIRGVLSQNAMLGIVVIVFAL